MGLISQHTIDRVFSDSRIEDVVGKFLPLEKSGSSYKGLSPFTKEKTPSFFVVPHKNIYKCFSSDKGGGAIKFLQDYKGMSFPQAVEYIARDVLNIEVEYQTNSEHQNKEYNKRESLRQPLNKAVELYNKTLLALPESHPCILALSDRGYTREDIIEWELGYSPENSTLVYDVVSKSEQMQSAGKAGLIGKGFGGFRDKFFNRLIFPIHDDVGRTVGLSGRALSDKSKAKYINSPTSELYQKSRILYGLHRSRNAVRNKGFVYVVEGYTDVITMHKHGFENTVATCGTSITPEHCKQLKRHCERVCLVLDNDDKEHNAGLTSALKSVDLFLSLGFSVELATLPKGQDPDSFCRSNPKDKLPELLKSRTHDAVIFKAESIYDPSATQATHQLQAKQIAELLANIKDKPTRQDYINTLSRKKGLSKSLLSLSVQPNASNQETESPESDWFELPKRVRNSSEADRVRMEVNRYKMFQYDNQIFTVRHSKGEDSPATFTPVSNFKAECVQHMEGPKNSYKLIRFTNMQGESRTFSASSDSIVTPLAFKRLCVDQGRFIWSGTSADHDRLLAKFLDEMKTGRMINILGHQPEGFFVFNNAAVCDGKKIEVDDNGCFLHEGNSYYVPSANKIYRDNPERFIAQKKVIYEPAKISLAALLKKMHLVHRSHAINASLFVIGTLFSDIIFQRVGSFPLLFLYGEAGSGKDNLIECCQSFFGKPQSPMGIVKAANTDVAKTRKFAQFSNMIGHLSEYKNGNETADNLLKDLWERKGYEHGTLESYIATNTVQVQMTIMFTGNDYPMDDAVISRMVAEEMNKRKFTMEQSRNFEELKQLVKGGVFSSYSSVFLKERERFKSEFSERFIDVKFKLKEHFKSFDIMDRMVDNMAVLGTVFRLFESYVDFPFNWDDFLANATAIYKQQAIRIRTENVSNRWWESVTTAMKKSLLVEDQHYAVSNDQKTIKINMKHASIAVKQVYPELYRERCTVNFKEKLKAQGKVLEVLNSTRFRSNKSSAYVFDLEDTGFKDELLIAAGIESKFLPEPPKNQKLPF